MTSKSKFIALIGTVGMLLTGSSLFAQGIPMVPVSKVEMLSEQGTKQYIGKLSSIHTVTLRLRVSGVLQKLYCKEGDMVKEGDLLMQIEDTLYKAQLDAATAKVKQWEAEVEHARTNYKRQTELFGVVAKSEMDDARRALKLAEAQLLQANASLTEAKTNYSYTKIYSPITGIIGKTTYSPGNYLTPSSDALATIVKHSPIYMKMAISEPDFIKMFGTRENLQKNAVIRIRTADRKMFGETGYVKLVDNQIDTSTGTLMLWCVFENKSGRLLPGSIVDAFISRKVAQKYPAIRTSAVMVSKNGHGVYVLDKENKVQYRPVVIGELIGDMQLIVSGLNEGERVVVDGTHKVRPGMVVAPAPIKSINPARDLSKAVPQSQKVKMGKLPAAVKK